ncbi:saccharopine dehydrogenase [Campylobacter hyointestinalis]|uniref:hypothetical protein n=1 Tax=Campylobacter hyointestinalis TaxID=198 RepID=UPI0004D397E3|nr:hypothetical protein [Campylobacter hyointestinalis]KEA44458.1 hypothetical protein CR67_04145 [Campylobacter hyointestinalis subsp. hyointestinalis]QKF55194.1 hypothetical protein CHHT_0321 [Campylobacter hyointestinalis subsp. hyointestinalis]TWO31209.1 hypothetical protein YZ79_00590 [Campylobacter hyointestinalis]TXK46213.1 hypothetical protein A0Z69_07875 [Campylobacter hyointestinalis]SFT50791.1 hypothetical protein SAMN05421691_0921 [Campylobacter hyointestinalis]
MKVIVVNDNPAVSRLINISLTRLGYEFNEVKNLEDITSKDNELLICDSSLFDKDVDYSSYAKNILYLVPRGSKIDENAQILEKPFLPTDFIETVEKIISPKNHDKAEDKNSDFNDLDAYDNVKLGNEFGEFKDIKDADFEDNQDEIEASNDSFLDLDDDDKATNNALTDEKSDEKSEPDEIQNDQAQNTQIQIKEDENAKDELDGDLNLDDLESEKIDENGEKEDELDELNDEDVKENIQTKNSDKELDELSSMIDEIDQMDLDAKDLNENDIEEYSDIKEQDVDEFAFEDIESLKEDLDLQDIEDEKQTIVDEPEQENIDDDTQNLKDLEEDMEPNENLQNLDEIKEDEIKQALDEPIIETTQNLPQTKDALPGELAQNIGKELETLLSSGSLKEVLKGLNIKINISFEEKE